MPATEIRLFRDAKGTVPVMDWLDGVTDDKLLAKAIAAIKRLASLGYELRRPTADFLRDGIFELRFRKNKVHYRILYFFSGKGICVLSHVITKEGKVDSAEIDRAIEKMKRVEQDSDKYTASF